MHSHRNVLVNTAMTAVMHVRTGEDTVVTALPCPHVYGNVVMNASLLYGMTLVLLPSFDPVEVMAAIEEHRATLFEGVPTMFMYMLAHPEFDRFDLSSLTPLHGGRPDHAGGQDGGVRAARGLPPHRAVGHDGGRGAGHHHAPCTERTATARSGSSCPTSSAASRISRTPRRPYPRTRSAS